MSAQDDRKKIEEALKAISVNQEGFEMVVKAQAGLYWQCYTKLKEAGFNDKQALTITIRKGPYLV